MTKVISLFNHKGGVSKTTTTFHLGWSLAKLGYKVLVVDCDPQCNLTGLALTGIEDEDDFDNFYSRKENSDIHSLVEPLFEGVQVEFAPIKLAGTGHDNLHLLAGSIELQNLDLDLAFGLKAGSAIPFAYGLVGAINALIRQAAKENEIDVVLIDMSPSVSALNRCILMGSDYFIVPTSPDYFCYQAINSLHRLLPKWSRDFKPFRDSKLKRSLPVEAPKMLGIISQRYRPRKNKGDKQDTTKAFQEWIDKINEQVNKRLVPSLKKEDMVISEESFNEHVKPDHSPYNLSTIKDFNTLVAMSQKYSKPVFTLTKKELDRTGAVLEQTQKNQKDFQRLFEELAISVSGLTGL